jgi:hypothetical protein
MLASLAMVFCKTAEVKDPMQERIDEYLAVDPNAKELFRVLMTSDRYLLTQMNHADRIRRNEDSGGDSIKTRSEDIR